MSRGTSSAFSESVQDEKEQPISEEVSSILSFSSEVKQSVGLGLGLLGDVRGALKFLLASRDVKP